MTKGSKLRGDLALLTDQIGRQLDDLERTQTENASDIALAVEQIEAATAQLGEEWHQLHLRHCTQVASILGRLANSTNAKMIQTGLIYPPDGVQQIAEKCKPDLSRIEARKEK